MPKETRSDRELLEAWVRKDRAAGSELIQRHFVPLRRFLASKVPADDLQDLIQTTLLECTGSVERFRHNSLFRTYLFAIARHQLLHYYRKRGRKFDRIDPLTHSIAALTVDSPMAQVLNDRRRGLLTAALRQLPLDLQITIELKFCEHFSEAQCAEVMGVKRSTVRGRLSRAKTKLTAILEAMDDSSMTRDGRDEMRGWIRSVKEALGMLPEEFLEPNEPAERRPRKRGPHTLRERTDG